jgi:hypothetical protein
MSLHCVVSQNIFVFRNTALRALNLTSFQGIQRLDRLFLNVDHIGIVNARFLKKNSCQSCKENIVREGCKYPRRQFVRVINSFYDGA